MAADTFGKAWHSLRLHCATLPPLLARDMTLQAYRDISSRRSWSYLRAEGEFLINASKTGNCDMTRGSATVPGSGGPNGMTFAASDVDRQFRVGTPSKVYTILSVSLAGNTSAVIDGPFGGSTGNAQPSTVLDAYVTAPLDFARWLAVLDLLNNWQLRIWITQDEINVMDAQRSNTGTPWAIVDRRLSQTAANIGRPLFELWPYCLSQRNFPYFYFKQAQDPADTDPLEGPLAARSELLVNRALALVSEWPGTEDRKNPYFNLALSQMKYKETEEQLNRLEVIDEEMFGTWLETVSYLNRYPFAPIDSKFFQSHDVPWGAGVALSY